MNALEVLNARSANREQWGQKETRDPVYDAMWPERPPYHSPEWWDMLWKKHEEWREGTYSAPAGTGWEVTPVSGKVVS